MMNELDKWSAEACGVLVDSYGSEGSPIAWKQTGAEYDWIEGYWTLSDARCMALVENKFCIDTHWCSKDKWRSYSINKYEGIGKTPHEARINCAQAIMEASK